MNNELVSVIMPAYNSALFISQAIESVIAQTYTNWELIIVDDGSTDDTSIIVSNYLLKERRISYYYQENNKQAAARNLGISLALGNIVAFLDSDDVWLENKLEISMISFNLDLFDLFSTNAFISNSENLITDKEKNRNMGITDAVYTGTDSIKKFIEINRIATSTVLVKKHKIIAVGGFRTEFVLAEDYDLWLRLLKNKCTFKSISTKLTIYRDTETSSSASDRLVTRYVVNSILDNFSSTELEKLNVKGHLKIWTNRWIKFCFDYETADQDLLLILKNFGLYKKIFKIIIIFKKIIPPKIFKYLIINNL
jgi:teichuronic acid biosynthesis glycosyltransferase TuaG